MPEEKRATRAGLIGALTEHYRSPGRLADYRRQFEKTTRQEGEDPSIFAISLEALAVKAFGDMGPNARLRLIRTGLSPDMRTVLCDGIWIVFHRRLPSGALLTDAECGRATRTLASGELSNQCRRGLYRYTLWTNRRVCRLTGW